MGIIKINIIKAFPRGEVPEVTQQRIEIGIL